MASSVPGRRTLPDSAYDLDSYWGRVKHCAEVSDPRMLLNTPTDINKAKKAIAEWKNGDGPMTPTLWTAKRVLDSTLHPDNGEPVMLPFRMSSYVLSNLVVTVGMLTPNLGTAGTLFWQIANQSLNVAVNTANANKSTPLTTQQLVTSYFMAVTASCSVALGLNALVPRLKVSPATRTVLGRLVPFAAVVSAGVVNVFLMRGEELRRGIAVYNPENNEKVGDSKKAAFYAVGETALSRVINAAPVMAIPPLILVKLQKTKFMRTRGKFTEAAVNLGLISLVSFSALPFALAIFPQKRFISTKKLEPEFQKLPENRLWFNRGM
ncbi:putative mitochondrial transport protein [Yarrowia sp. B02]|nr:putative mitochondrial transport protein [Yarrowia sp. B02]